MLSSARARAAQRVRVRVAAARIVLRENILRSLAAISRAGEGCVTLGFMADLIDNADRARRLARAIASDLTLYNEAKIVSGIQNDTLFDVMKDEIEEGRALYKSRVTPEVFSMNIYEKALVDVMLKSKGHVKSKIW